MTTEIWRDIPGYEGAYQVSGYGRVRSLARKVRAVGRTGTEALRSVPPRVLRPGTLKSGHVSVAPGKGRSRDVHRLVLAAFIGPPPPGHEVLHRNHQPNDNRLVNLKYGTRSENLKMDYAAGTRSVHPNFIGARWRYVKDTVA